MTSEWTIATLKEHTEALRAADQRAVDIALNAAKEAVQVALQVQKEQRNEDKRATDNRFENANEFRGQLKDQAGSFITRAEFDQAQRNSSGDRFSGRTDIRGTVTMVIALVVLAVTAYANLAP